MLEWNEDDFSFSYFLVCSFVIHRHDDLIADEKSSRMIHFVYVNLSLTDMWDDLISRRCEQNTPLDLLSINGLQPTRMFSLFHRFLQRLFSRKRKEREKPNTDGRESTRNKWRLCWNPHPSYHSIQIGQVPALSQVQSPLARQIFSHFLSYFLFPLVGCCWILGILRERWNVWGNLCLWVMGDGKFLRFRVFLLIWQQFFIF